MPFCGEKSVVPQWARPEPHISSGPPGAAAPSLFAGIGPDSPARQQLTRLCQNDTDDTNRNTQKHTEANRNTQKHTKHNTNTQKAEQTSKKRKRVWRGGGEGELRCGCGCGCASQCQCINMYYILHAIWYRSFRETLNPQYTNIQLLTLPHYISNPPPF